MPSGGSLSAGAPGTPDPGAGTYKLIIHKTSKTIFFSKKKTKVLLLIYLP